MAKPIIKHSAYRPHERVYEHGELRDGIIPPSMAKQEFKRECDVNNIVKHFSPRHMSQLAALAAANGRFEDLPDQLDYQDSLNLIRDAEQAFMALPSKVRDRFGQDPAEFLAFMGDPSNEKEARELGLLKPLPPAQAAPLADAESSQRGADDDKQTNNNTG